MKNEKLIQKLEKEFGQGKIIYKRVSYWDNISHYKTKDKEICLGICYTPIVYSPQNEYKWQKSNSSSIFVLDINKRITNDDFDNLIIILTANDNIIDETDIYFLKENKKYILCKQQVRYNFPQLVYHNYLSNGFIPF